jgi:branched-chain amino acid transport system substrate-binding protein
MNLSGEVHPVTLLRGFRYRVVRRLIGIAMVGLATSAARAEIAIGVAGPLSGPFAVLGEQMRAGAAQAVADINEAGGINGETLVLHEMDDACDAKQADAAANQLAGRGVAMVVGHLCLGASIAASQVYALNHIVQISPGTTYPAFTDERPGPGVFRLAARDDQQALVAGTFLATHFADARIVIVNDDSIYGKGLADAVREAMNAAGKRETLTVEYEGAGDNYQELVLRLKASDIDVVFVGGYAADIGVIARQMREAAMDATLIAGDALAADEFPQIAGGASEGTLMTFPSDLRRSPEAATVVRELRSQGIEPEGYVLAAYTAVQVWAAAATAAGSTAFDAVVPALGAGDFPTVLGRVSFDANGDANLPGFTFYEWKGGSYDYLPM